MKKLFRICLIGAAIIGSAQLTGCAQLQMSQPKPAIENTVKLRGTQIAPAAVGAFKIDPAKADLDTGVSLRGANSVKSPIEGSFAKYLAETLKVELQAAGLYDAASATVISGTLTRSKVDPAMGTGTGELGARFVVTRSGNVKFDRELTVNSSWDSSFIGSIAIPAAAQQYEAMYRKLVGVLLDDADFRTAVAK